MKNYFTINDEFSSIISRVLNCDVGQIEIQRSQHGKSSFVFFVYFHRESFLFKFPRTTFQAESILYEDNMARFFVDKFNFNVPLIRVYYDEEIPFSVYPLIDGTNMSDVRLSDYDISRLCNQLAEILVVFKQADFCSIKTKLKTKEQLIRDFCRDFEYSPDFTLIEDIICDDIGLIHGDFHRSNILLNKSKNISGLLDFATVSIGSIYYDLGQMCFSMNEKFNDIFVATCEQRLNLKFDRNKIKRMVEFLDNMINKNYLPFIRRQYV